MQFVPPSDQTAVDTSGAETPELSLQTLLGRTSKSRFISSHWPHRFLVIHDNPGRLKVLGEIDALQGIGPLLKAAEKVPGSVFLKAWYQDKSGRHQSLFPKNAREAMKLYEKGDYTLVVDQVDRLIPQLRNFLMRLQGELGSPMPISSCNVYASPPGTGTVMHYDHQENFIVQLSGRKRWKVASNNLVKFPSVGYHGQTPLPPELEEVKSRLPTAMPKGARDVDLEPGSVMFLPRGYWHQSFSLTHSFALTLTFPSCTWADFILGDLRNRLHARPEWREPVSGIKETARPRAETMFKWERMLRELKKMI